MYPNLFSLTIIALVASVATSHVCGDSDYYDFGYVPYEGNYVMVDKDCNVLQRFDFPLNAEEHFSYCDYYSAERTCPNGHWPLLCCRKDASVEPNQLLASNHEASAWQAQAVQHGFD
ncbi:hypothetical protein CYLTODRAFT_419080 [Cylindrobasidium torrendii FP15055 ss-10]|uniref:Chitin-binding type-2 domain-containing protein n=1 Tax=Cylindrobasidium torrendii FP15055 ss-10 TaxID=1314674 RepID=A0A0D7BLA8_9AGAR|nr:hypothetical protein CYLTODRAFT_419080 [Cylindrobasidium torrendii FP15055 ss-10]